MRAKIPKIFSWFVNGYISPYPVVETVVRDHDAEAVYASIADFASPSLRRVIQVLVLGSFAISKLEIMKKMQESQWTKKKMNKKTFRKSITIPMLSLKKNHSNYNKLSKFDYSYSIN
jgi:hypothetical protein